MKRGKPGPPCLGGAGVAGTPYSGEHAVSTREFTDRTGATSQPTESEDGTKELLLSEGVFGRRHWYDEGVFAHVGFTVGQEICGCLGDLQGTQHRCWVKGQLTVGPTQRCPCGHGQGWAVLCAPLRTRPCPAWREGLCKPRETGFETCLVERGVARGG